jgi:hypothetical protein
MSLILPDRSSGCTINADCGDAWGARSLCQNLTSSQGLARCSGTTWLGQIIASTSLVAYIHEPFNVMDPPRPGICNVRFTQRFGL